MKHIFLSILSILFFSQAFCQQDSIAPYKKFTGIPPFSLIIAPDSTAFTEKDLKKKEPVMFILFSPDCSHCIVGFKNLMENIDLYKNVQIIMSSPLSYGLEKKFYDEYHVSDYPNIIIGRDPSAYLNSFFVNRNFPSVFIYDRKGKFRNEVRGHPDFKKIAELF